MTYFIGSSLRLPDNQNAFNNIDVSNQIVMSQVYLRNVTQRSTCLRANRWRLKDSTKVGLIRQG
jgi:hypothetical protein